MTKATARTLAIIALLSGAAPVAAQTPAAPATPTPAASAVRPIEGGPDFISPMGEPVRSDDALSGAEHWFARADADHDGRLTRDEMRADAARFFATLDTDHDGELSPDEITRYETVVAPEITVTSTLGDMSKAKTDDSGNVTMPPYPTRLGAGRYGYIDLPEPVIACDTNFDRGVSKQEFDAAAGRRFKLLDTDGDGVVTRAELPKLAKVGGGDGETRRRRGGHRPPR